MDLRGGFGGGDTPRDAAGGDWLVPIVIVHYVALAHIVGGLMLAAGFFTRLGSAVQIPILIGATFFVHLSQGLVSPGQSLELSALVLFLLLVIFAFGSGRWSADQYLRTQESSATMADRSLA
jgi:putative oxidoreductase